MNHKILAAIILSTFLLLSLYNIQADISLPQEPLEAQRGYIKVQDRTLWVYKQRAGINDQNLPDLCEEIETTFYHHTGSPITSFNINLEQNAIHSACPLYKTLKEITTSQKVTINLNSNVINQPLCFEDLKGSDVTLSLVGNSIKDYSGLKGLKYNDKIVSFSLDLSQNFAPIDQDTFSFLSSYTTLEFFKLKLHRNHLQHFEFLTENTFFRNVKTVQLDFSHNDMNETSELLKFYTAFNAEVDLRLNLYKNQISMPEMSYFNNKLTNSYPNGQISFNYYQPEYQTFN